MDRLLSGRGSLARAGARVSVLSLVLAMADNGVIGAKGSLPWRIPEDMRRFKALTMGKPVIMGRKTWESLPQKPLAGRKNIVVTRDQHFAAEGAIVAASLEQAISEAGKDRPVEIMIIGGAEIYSAALPLAGRIHLTEVHLSVDGDTRMPKFDPTRWAERAREERVAKDGLRFSYVTLDRR